LAVARHDNGIHELTFLDNGKAVLDEWYDCEVFLNSVTSDDVIVSQLFNLRNGIGPVAYFMQKSRQLFIQIPNLSRHRVALVYSRQYATMAFAGLSLLNSLPMVRGTTRYFKDTQFGAAIAWLLSNK
jgi:hypothetical protein